MISSGGRAKFIWGGTCKNIPKQVWECHPAAVSIFFNGFPKFTNEVQHLYKVLLWDKSTNNLRLKNGAK
ncbi:MAG: hypothetical protein CVT49_13765, partial [candidate division Zixibacteria bacterium HGW-Zixibacteria-1]